MARSFLLISHNQGRFSQETCVFCPPHHSLPARRACNGRMQLPLHLQCRSYHHGEMIKDGYHHRHARSRNPHSPPSRIGTVPRHNPDHELETLLHDQPGRAPQEAKRDGKHVTLFGLVVRLKRLAEEDGVPSQQQARPPLKRQNAEWNSRAACRPRTANSKSTSKTVSKLLSA